MRSSSEMGYTCRVRVSLSKHSIPVAMNMETADAAPRRRPNPKAQVPASNAAARSQGQTSNTCQFFEENKIEQKGVTTQIRKVNTCVCVCMPVRERGESGRVGDVCVCACMHGVFTRCIFLPHLHAHMHTHTCTRTRARTHTHVHTVTHTHTQSHTHAHTHRWSSGLVVAPIHKRGVRQPTGKQNDARKRGKRGRAKHKRNCAHAARAAAGNAQRRNAGQEQQRASRCKCKGAEHPILGIVLPHLFIPKVDAVCLRAIQRVRDGSTGTV